jgi:hypothetical protein
MAIRKTQTMRIALKRSLFGDTQNPNKAGFAQEYQLSSFELTAVTPS